MLIHYNVGHVRSWGHRAQCQIVSEYLEKKNAHKGAAGMEYMPPKSPLNMHQICVDNVGWV